MSHAPFKQLNFDGPRMYLRLISFTAKDPWLQSYLEYMYVGSKILSTAGKSKAHQMTGQQFN